jgi:hypothetical protein
VTRISGGRERLAQLGFLAAVAAIASAAVAAAPPVATVLSALDLSGSFATRSAWRFTTSQGPPIEDPTGVSGETAPGEVHLCLHKEAAGPCDPHLEEALRGGLKDDLFSKPHYLNHVQVVHGVSGRPLLLVQTASLHSGDGDQLVLTQALVYQRSSDRFVRVYDHSTGENNNQEVRYIEAGALKGDIISAEPTSKAPFGFWVTVNAFPSGSSYRQVLRYRSATRYGDGNPLSVIDSEMPNIEQRLGFWRPGSSLPLPAGRCPKPHLIRMELWCG